MCMFTFVYDLCCFIGSLHDALHLSAERIPIKTMIDLSIQIVEGVTFLHESHPQILHRDIKSKNIFIDSGRQAKIG